MPHRLKLSSAASADGVRHPRDDAFREAVGIRITDTVGGRVKAFIEGTQILLDHKAVKLIRAAARRKGGNVAGHVVPPFQRNGMRARPPRAVKIDARVERTCKRAGALF